MENFFGLGWLVPVLFTWLPSAIQMMLGRFQKDKRGKFYDNKFQHSQLKTDPLLALSDGQKFGQIPNILIFQSIHTHDSSSSLIQKALTREIRDQMLQNFGNKISKSMCPAHYLFFFQMTQNLTPKYLNYILDNVKKESSC